MTPHELRLVEDAILRRFPILGFRLNTEIRDLVQKAAAERNEEPS